MAFLINLVTNLLCDWSILSSNDCCQFISGIDVTATNVRMSINSALLRVSFSPSANSLIDLTTDAALQSLTVITYPPLKQGEDFVLYSLAKENALPAEMKMSKNKRMSVGLRLLPGKTWIKSMSSTGPTKLYIVGAYVCQSSPHPLIEYRNNETWTQVAVIAHRRMTCPATLQLPNASAKLSQLLNETLSNCRSPRIIKSKRLDWRRVSSLTLLSMVPPLLLVDGSDQDVQSAARAVDVFLAAHGVLEVVWEPYSSREPRWWVLVPRPSGMPGHLFAMMDMIQWTHPTVALAAQYRAQPLCNETVAGCVPGCPKTRIKGISGSGWGADTSHIVDAYQRFFVDAEPMQVGPFRLGYRANPPLWGGTIGWLYTYKGCESNFLDCYFLEHSPCPRINMDTWNDPGVSNFDKSRFESSEPENHNWEARPKWWSKVMGEASRDIPEESISDLHGLPSKHSLYTYFFRPNYDLRKIIHERVERFGLNEDCAVMHVRRGDSIMHGGQARGYLRVDTYVRAGRPLMDAMGIKTILLLTDSQGAIDEANKCAVDYPTICGGIVFRFVEKKRWVGAEGGWENPFPSGDSRTELLDIQFEFALAHKAKMAIVGDSNYAEKIIDHICCGFPFSPRGVMPHRCICPPHVNLKQYGFDCEHGNKISCADQDKGGDITRPLSDPSNMYGANFSLKENAFIQTTSVCLRTPVSEKCYDPSTSAVEVNENLVSYVERALIYSCSDYDTGPMKARICATR